MYFKYEKGYKISLDRLVYGVRNAVSYEKASSHYRSLLFPN